MFSPYNKHQTIGWTEPFFRYKNIYQQEAISILEAVYQNGKTDILKLGKGYRKKL